MESLLVVDDSATDRVRVAGLLKNSNRYNVFTATDGQDALDQLASGSIDLVLTDMQMPEMNGLQLVRTIKEDFPLTPVILMTAVGSEELAVDAMNEGAAGYVNKAGGANWLLTSVQQVLAARVKQMAHTELMAHLQTDQYDLELENNRALMSSTARFLKQAVQAVNLVPGSELPRIGIALEEALLNACLHGNLGLDSKLREEGSRFEELAAERSNLSPWSERRVRVTAEITPERMEISITDEGSGFSPTELPDPTDPENLLKPHGRGVMMMKMFLDDVSWNEKGNRVTLVKVRSAEA